MTATLFFPLWVDAGPRSVTLGPEQQRLRHHVLNVFFVVDDELGLRKVTLESDGAKVAQEHLKLRRHCCRHRCRLLPAARQAQHHRASSR